ncbi:MAG TPA: YoaP domain-containing protein [Bacteroidales bacterium]|nr:YoaP domain-containing protein [Bacteroidales bacterium]
MEKIISLDSANIAKEHICCAFSDKKCSESYEMKKQWLTREFENGYVFRRIDARAKVFIEYGPAEKGWAPVIAPNYLLVNCMWVSGQYKEHGYGKELLRLAMNDAIRLNKNGLVTITGISKFPFMNDGDWLKKQGFEAVSTTTSGFILLVNKIKENAPNPEFTDKVLLGGEAHKNGLVAYFSDRCPYAGFHVRNSLTETAAKRNLPLKIIKLETMEEAQAAPTPATIFSLFYNGRFVTTDISICLDSRFDKAMTKVLKEYKSNI